MKTFGNFVPAAEFFKDQHQKHITVYLDNFVLEFENTADVVEFVNAYTKAKEKEIKEEDYDNQSL